MSSVDINILGYFKCVLLKEMVYDYMDKNLTYHVYVE